MTGRREGGRPRVLVAEQDRPTRAGLGSVLGRGGFEVAGEAVDLQAAVAMAAAERPDVALVAVELPGGGPGATRQIAARAARTRIVVPTGRPRGGEGGQALLGRA